jgi:hypothetical protein
VSSANDFALIDKFDGLVEALDKKVEPIAEIFNKSIFLEKFLALSKEVSSFNFGIKLCLSPNYLNMHCSLY